MAEPARGPSVALARLLRRRRKELGLRLRDVEAVTSREGRKVSISTLSKIEQGRIEPGQRRLGMLMRIYEIPYRTVGDLIELEDYVREAPDPRTDPKRLHEEGVRLWKSGDVRGAVAHLLTLRLQSHGTPADTADRQKGLLSFAIVANSLGKHKLSRDILNELFQEELDDDLMVRALVHAGVTWNALGAPDVALAFLERATQHGQPGDPRETAWILHEKSTALRVARRFDLAREALDEAIEGYRKAGDSYGECLARGAMVKLHLAEPDLQGALTAARRARAHAEEHGFHRLAILRRLDEGTVLVNTGEAQEGVTLLGRGLASALESDDKVSVFYAHYHLWQAHKILGDEERARLEFDSAHYYLQFLDGTYEEAADIRKGDTQ